MKILARSQSFWRSLIAVLIAGGSWLAPLGAFRATAAQRNAFCQFSADAIAQKQQLLAASLNGQADAKAQYQALLKKHAEQLRRCRRQTWPREQAIWLRLYPCDVRVGELDKVFDRIVNQGYNEVYLEVFANGQVLLPQADNPTPWDSVVRVPGAEQVDLMAWAIHKGRERGLKVYAWMFTLNFGYTYAIRPDREWVLARNGRGQNSLSFVPDGSQAFVDPYNLQAQRDYHNLVKAVLERQPDGVLFDYVRYPRGSGLDSVAKEVQDLWIYGQAARQALSQRALNAQGRWLIERYLSQGSITNSDVEALKRFANGQNPPLWQGRVLSPELDKAGLDLRRRQLQSELWYLSVAHAAQGVIDFLTMATRPVQEQGLPAGAVFFPDGNQVVGQQGFDSRLQPWDRFPASLEWHPMAYAVCGNTGCIVDQIRRVVGLAPSQTQVTPALAGTWGKAIDNRPSLEAQMADIRRRLPHIDSVSHFAFSWQYPEFDRQRRFCKLR